MSRPTDSAPARAALEIGNAPGLLAALATLAILALLQAREPFYFLWDDNASYWLSSYVLAAESLAGEGVLAHLNVHQYLVQTHLASGQSGVLYPPAYVAVSLAHLLFGDVRATLDLLVAFHLAVSAVGFTVLLRSRGVSRAVALGVSLLWVTFPFVLQVSRSWVWVSAVAAWLPWSLWSSERSARRPSGGALAWSVVPKSLLLLQGFVQGALYAAVTEGALLLLSGRLSRLRRAAEWVLAHTLAALLAAPMLLPMMHARAVSADRAGPLPIEEVVSLSLPLRELLGAQFFRVSERVVHEGSGIVFYVGLPLIVLLPSILLRGARGRRDGLAAVAVAVVAVIASTRLYGLLADLPLLGSFRWPFKGFFFALFAATLGFAVALEALRRHTGALRHLGRVGLLAALGLHVFLAVSPLGSATFGPNRLDTSVEELRREVRDRVPVERGRVVSLWLHPSEPRIHRFLPFNFATLAGAHHLGGYDPLVSATNLRLAKGLEYSNIFRYELTPSALDYLSSWSVRYFLAPDRSQFPEIFARFPQLRVLSRADGLLVVENLAAEPFADLVDPETGESTPLEVEWGAASIRVATRGRAGTVRLRVAPLENYRALVDGVSDAPLLVGTRERLLVPVPPGSRFLELRWIDPRFRFGVGVTLLTLLGAAALALRSQRLARRKRRESLLGA